MGAAEEVRQLCDDGFSTPDAAQDVEEGDLVAWADGLAEEAVSHLVNRALGTQQCLAKQDDNVERVVEVCSLPAGGQGLPVESRHAPIEAHCN